ncbi:MAG TPA: hypothetical protein VHR45_20600 [Thermoanaerobaculia bacterium]|nr:hypothetical protein [Thermoanaerobaculia bacterium]
MNGLAASPVTIAGALVLAGAVALLGALGIWRGGAGWRGWRLAALAAALLGLLGLVLSPWRATPAASGRAVLITAGAHRAVDEVNAIDAAVALDALDALGALDPIDAVDAADAQDLRLREPGGGGRWQALPDARTLWRREPWLRRLEVRGYGLEPGDLDGFAGAIERFDPPALPPGVMAALWPRRLRLGEPLLVEARVAPATTGRLELRGPGGVEADADAAAARRGVTLSTVPRAPGHLLYHLVVRDSRRRELASEPLDVTIEPPRPPAVLALLGAPSFDSQALLRWLTGAGVPFVARQELTRGRARVAALWSPDLGGQPPAAPLEAASLARFDALVIDGRSLQAISPRERAALGAALDAGLGILLFDADPARGEEAGFDLRSRPLPGTARAARLRWPGQEPLPALTVPSREIVPQPEVEPLVWDGDRHVLAARTSRGRGWIARSLIDDSFHLRFDSGAHAYDALWGRLLGAVARPEASPRFVLPAGPALVDRPLDLELVALGERAPSAEVADGPRVSPLPVYATGPGRFAARLWPRHEGWLRLTASGASGGATAWIHASGGRSWDTWRRAARIAATSTRAAAPAAGRPPAAVAPRPWPRLPFYALFLGGAGCLWLLERLRAGSR